MVTEQWTQEGELPSLEEVREIYQQNHALWGIEKTFTYGLTPNRIRYEVQLCPLVRNASCIIREGESLYTTDPEVEGDLMYMASIIKPFFSYALVHVLGQAGVKDIPNHLIELSIDEIKYLHEELVKRKQVSMIQKLSEEGCILSAEPTETTSISVSELINLADIISSNVATAIIKNTVAAKFAELSGTENDGVLTFEEYLKQEFNLSQLEINRGAGRQRRSNTGSLQELTKAFDQFVREAEALPQYLVNSVRDNKIDFKFGVTQLKADIEKIFGKPIKHIYEKTGYWEEVDWPLDLPAPEYGSNPIHMLMATLFSIEFEDGEIL